jgi:hypothetical protein
MDEKPESIRSEGGGGHVHCVAVDLEDSNPQRHRMIPVWFFVGVILLIYGIIILGTGIYEYSSPPPTVLSSTHPALWWGALLIIIGGIYVYVYKPKKA